MLESQYQKNIKRKIKVLFPNAIVLKTDEQQIQGFPDLLILEGSKWAALEVKKSESSPRRPNQEYWVEQLDFLSFASFIYPENEEEVLYDLGRAFGS